MTRKTRAAFPAWAVLFLCALFFTQKAHANYGSTITKTLTTGAGAAQFTSNLAGQLTERSFPDSSHENFAYNSAGAATTWTTPRATLGLTPNAFGQPTTFGSAGSLGYDLAGRVNSMSTAADTFTQSYENGQRDVESHTSGVLKGQSVDRDYDSLGRLWKVNLPGSVTITYSYDPTTGALSGVTTAGGASGTWSNFDPVTGKAKTFTMGPLTVTGSFDGLGRVTGHASTAAGVTASYGYGWDGDGHCNSVSGPNGSWTLGYSNHGYLESATGWKNYTYSFDEAGLPAGAVDWHPSVRLNSSVVDVFGSVTPGATLTINSGTVAVDGTTGRFNASYTPTTDSWQSYVVRGTLAGAGNNGTDAVAEEVRNIFVPPASETLGYDLSGNLSSDARWTQAWNDLDQMTSSDEATPLLPATKMRVEYSYDLQGRRVEKKVSIGGVVMKRTTTLWDGWRPVMEIDYKAGSYELARRYYTWGPDVSGSIDGAAGIGGLIEIFEKRGSTTTRSLPINDGIGNVVGYVDGTTGARVATFSYGPFGEVIEAWGERVSSCPFRYQTKVYDQETNLSYFGKRYLEPKTGWLSRDPLREDGGVNLYAYAGNNPIGSFDPIGLAPGDFEREHPVGAFLFKVFRGVTAPGRVVLGPFLTNDPDEFAERTENLMNFASGGQMAYAAAEGDPEKSKQVLRGLKDQFTTVEGVSSLATVVALGRFAPNFMRARAIVPEASGFDFIADARVRVEATNAQYGGVLAYARATEPVLATAEWTPTPGQVGQFARTSTPWGRSVWQRSNIDWALKRPDGLTNLEAASKGYAPMRQIGNGFEKVQMHHLNQNPTGALAEVWDSTHHAPQLHNLVPPPSWRVTDPVAAAAFRREVPAYWRWRAGQVGE